VVFAWADNHDGDAGDAFDSQVFLGRLASQAGQVRPGVGVTEALGQHTSVILWGSSQRIATKIADLREADHRPVSFCFGAIGGPLEGDRVRDVVHAVSEYGKALN
jgi:hypothetical protein